MNARISFDPQLVRYLVLWSLSGCNSECRLFRWNLHWINAGAVVKLYVDEIRLDEPTADLSIIDRIIYEKMAAATTTKRRCSHGRHPSARYPN